MIKAVLISAAVGFSLPYLIDIPISGILPFRIIPLPLETGLRWPSSPAHDIFASQVVNRSQKADKLGVLQPGQRAIYPDRNTSQKLVVPESNIKIGCERPFSGAVRISEIVGRCLADAEQLYGAIS